MSYARTRLFIGVVVAFMLAGCAGMPSDFEQPSLTISNIVLRNSTGLAPQFDIVMHITNPNRDPLEIVGMSYEIYLSDNKVVSGVSNDFPVIEPYGEADVSVIAIVNLLGSIQLLRDLTRASQDNLDYEFMAKLDIGRAHPRINIEKSGVVFPR
jgi:LEA14-like dessication related protein